PIASSSCAPDRDHRCLNSFPTRRSSDLSEAIRGRAFCGGSRRTHPPGSIQSGENVNGSTRSSEVMAASEVASPWTAHFRETVLLDRQSTRLNSRHVKTLHAAVRLPRQQC